MAFAQSVLGVHSMVGSTIHRPVPKGPPLVFRPMIFFTVQRNPSQRLSASFCANQAGNEFKRAAGQVRSELQASQDGTAAVDITQFKHILLPITDRNPYLSEGTRQAAATTTALAKKYGADITVVVIDENNREVITEHDARLSSIRWHLAQGGFEEFGLMERLGEGKRPTAVIGEVADELNLDLVVISMEAIHSKHVDANLLAEFVPCPVLLLPL